MEKLDPEILKLANREFKKFKAQQGEWERLNWERIRNKINFRLQLDWMNEQLKTKRKW